MLNDFYRNKVVLITGHTGFKGSWLSLWLQSCGAKVIGYALSPPTVPSLFVTASVADGMTSITGDVRDFSALLLTFQKYQPEIVIHMAAQALVRYSYDNPIETYGTNVMGTVNMLEAARLTSSVRAIVNVTSDKCYENREWVWGYRENEPMGGYDPYSSSKGCAELVTAGYRNSYFSQDTSAKHRVLLASARAGNVVGGGDWAEDRLIPDIMRAMLAGKSVSIRNPNTTRPWQHVLEPLSGYLMLAQKLCEEDGAAYSEPWNFGPNDEEAKPVSWIVDRLTQMWGEGASWTLDTNVDHPHEAHHLKLDCSKARAKLGFTPRTDLKTALNWTVEWYKQYNQKSDMRKVTEAQIMKFESVGMPPVDLPL